MLRLLRNWLALWLSALRRIAEAHPGIFSVSACSVAARSPEYERDERLR
jgi:hypothetical protein